MENKAADGIPLFRIPAGTAVVESESARGYFVFVEPGKPPYRVEIVADRNGGYEVIKHPVNRS